MFEIGTIYTWCLFLCVTNWRMPVRPETYSGRPSRSGRAVVSEQGTRKFLNRASEAFPSSWAPPGKHFPLPQKGEENVTPGGGQYNGEASEARIKKILVARCKMARINIQDWSSLYLKRSMHLTNQQKLKISKQVLLLGCFASMNVAPEKCLREDIKINKAKSLLDAKFKGLYVCIKC